MKHSYKTCSVIFLSGASLALMTACSVGTTGTGAPAATVVEHQNQPPSHPAATADAGPKTAEGLTPPVSQTNPDTAKAQTSKPAPQDDTVGFVNTAYGYQALYSNTTGYHNTAVGDDALHYNTTGSNNTANGFQALLSNTTGGDNTANGSQALFLNTKGGFNVANGSYALYANTTGGSNTANGYGALSSNTTGNNNTANGSNALYANSTGFNNVANGFQALFSNTTGAQNTANGFEALYANTTGAQNTANGFEALYNNTTGSNNTANGFQALSANTLGTDNTAIGRYALSKSTTGSRNIALGGQAGCNLTAGSDNIYIGNLGAGSESGVIRIGGSHANNPFCPDSVTLPIQTSTYITGISGVPITGGAAVYVKTDGQLGVQASSRRFKEQIAPVGVADETLMKLRPVQFQYKNGDTGGDQAVQYGLIAEEVAHILPEMVQFDAEGEPFAVNYQFLGPLLLAMVQKQQAVLESIQQQNIELRNELDALRAVTVAGVNKGGGRAGASD